MARLPVPGQDDGVWGDILNDYLLIEHNADGTQKTLPVAQGGTGAVDAATARGNLGTASASDLTNHLNDAGDPHAVYLLKSGGTMTGSLTLNADPGSPLQAATKQYVDARTGDIVLTRSALLSRNTIALPGTAAGKFDGLVVDPDMSVELAANTSYAFHMTLHQAPASGTADIFIAFRIPSGASGWAEYDAVSSPLYVPTDAARDAYQMGWPSRKFTQHYGVVTTGVASGTFSLAWQPYASVPSGAQAVDVGTILRLTPIS